MEIQNKVDYFEDRHHISALNRHLAIHGGIVTPHGIAGATGCKLEEAMELLLMLYHKRHADAYLLVFHSCDWDTPSITLPLAHGFPKLPLVCDLCQEEIIGIDELYFGFMFSARATIKFTNKSL